MLCTCPVIPWCVARGAHPIPRSHSTCQNSESSSHFGAPQEITSSSSSTPTTVALSLACHPRTQNCGKFSCLTLCARRWRRRLIWPSTTSSGTTVSIGSRPTDPREAEEGAQPPVRVALPAGSRTVPRSEIQCRTLLGW